MMRDQDYMPIYKKIKEQILNDIAKGIYGPGDMLPKQTEFADAYGVSRVTVREAFNELKLRGILVSKKEREHLSQITSVTFMAPSGLAVFLEMLLSTHMWCTRNSLK